MLGIHWKQVFPQKLSSSLKICGCQRRLRIALTNDFGASEAMADDMRNMLMKIPKCMLVIVLTGTFEHSPVTVFQYWTCRYWLICSTYSEGSATRFRVREISDHVTIYLRLIQA